MSSVQLSAIGISRWLAAFAGRSREHTYIWYCLLYLLEEAKGFESFSFWPLALI